jgi:hypothetical protein
MKPTKTKLPEITMPCPACLTEKVTVLTGKESVIMWVCKCGQAVITHVATGQG